MARTVASSVTAPDGSGRGRTTPPEPRRGSGGACSGACPASDIIADDASRVTRIASGITALLGRGDLVEAAEPVHDSDDVGALADGVVEAAAHGLPELGVVAVAEGLVAGEGGPGCHVGVDQVLQPARVQVHQVSGPEHTRGALLGEQSRAAGHDPSFRARWRLSRASPRWSM